jgi:hypothetical protein
MQMQMGNVSVTLTAGETVPVQVHIESTFVYEFGGQFIN